MTEESPIFPDPSLLASIEHCAEKLGHLLSKMEATLGARAKQEHEKITLQHTLAGTMLMKEWFTGQISDERYSAIAAELLESSSATYDGLRMTHESHIAHLHATVQEAMARGRAEYGDLEFNLDQILQEGTSE